MTLLARFPEGTVAEMHELSTGIRMRTFARGQGDVAIFLHGFPELAFSWRAQLEGLASHARCVAPDLRGYGESSAPRAVSDYRIDLLQRDVIALCDALGAARVHLVGHDWGGAIAWEVARAYPERLSSLTVLNCPPAELFLRIGVRHPRQWLMSGYMFFFQLPVLPERMFRRDPLSIMMRAFRGTALNREPFTTETVAPYAAQAERSGMRGGLNYYRAAARSLRLRRPRKLSLPVRLIWGLGDRALGPWFADPALYRDIASRFDLVPIASAGHWVQQEAAAEVNAAILEHWSTKQRTDEIEERTGVVVHEGHAAERKGGA